MENQKRKNKKSTLIKGFTVTFLILKFEEAELFLIGSCQDEWFELTYYVETLPSSLLQFSLAASLSISFGSLVFRVATYWNIINVDDHYNDLDRERTEWITDRGVVRNFNLRVNKTNAPSFCPDKIIFVPDKIIFVPDKITLSQTKHFCPRQKILS